MVQLALMFVGMVLLSSYTSLSSSPAAIGEPTEESTYTTMYYGHKFDIPYRIANATLEEIKVDLASERVEILLSAKSNTAGHIEITIPRNFFWSDLLNEWNYTVLAEGHGSSKDAEHLYLENAPCYRTISIKFPPTTEKLVVMTPSYQPTLRSIVSDGFIATDKACYRQGEPVTVFGYASIPIDLWVNSEALGEEYPPDINFTHYQNGFFTSTFVIEGSGAYSGIYAAIASYKSDDNSILPYGSSDTRFLLFERDYDGLVVGQTSLIDYKGEKASVAQQTSLYTIATEVDNNGSEPKSFRYIVMITDEDDIAQRIFDGTFDVAPQQKRMVGAGYLVWIPEVRGKYQIGAFVWSREYFPLESLASVEPIVVEVKEKIISLGKGERDRDIAVRDINFLFGTVTVSYAICSKTGGAEERTIHIGESVLIAEYVWAYFEGLENDKAIFRFEPTGRGCVAGY